MTATEETLGKFIEKAATRAWEDHRSPYFLSSLSPEFREEGHDYKAVIGEERLKTAVKRLSGRFNFTVVEHATQRAKVGVIPKGEAFEFEEKPTSRRGTTLMASHVEERQRITIEFINELGRLPPDLLDGVVIPTKVLVRLLARA